MKRGGKATVADARIVVMQAVQRYGRGVFPVNVAGPRYAALKVAEIRGWVWFSSRDRASVTAAGQVAVADFTSTSA